MIWSNRSSGKGIRACRVVRLQATYDIIINSVGIGMYQLDRIYAYVLSSGGMDAVSKWSSEKTNRSWRCKALGNGTLRSRGRRTSPNRAAISRTPRLKSPVPTSPLSTFHSRFVPRPALPAAVSQQFPPHALTSSILDSKLKLELYAFCPIGFVVVYQLANPPSQSLINWQTHHLKAWWRSYRHDSNFGQWVSDFELC